ncbi:MAG: hypothetical protein KAI24_11915, partial [Planctomycetes bacterium]|nr:hypothetical protein [Planctomycetota bacterium]
MTPTSRWLRRAGFVLAVVTLHVLAVVPLHDPAQLRDAVLTVSPDLLLLAAVAVIGGAAGRPGLVAHLAAALLLLATFLRVADVVTLTAFGKEFELADFGRVWPIFDAWANKAGAFQRWAWGIGMLLALALLHWLVARAFRVVARTAAQPRGAAAWLVALQALVLAGVLCPHRAFQPSPLRMLVAVSVDALREWLDPGSVLGPVRAEITAAAQR